MSSIYEKFIFREDALKYERLGGERRFNIFGIAWMLTFWDTLVEGLRPQGDSYGDTGHGQFRIAGFTVVADTLIDLENKLKRVYSDGELCVKYYHKDYSLERLQRESCEYSVEGIMRRIHRALIYMSLRKVDRSYDDWLRNPKFPKRRR